MQSEQCCCRSCITLRGCRMWRVEIITRSHSPSQPVLRWIHAEPATGTKPICTPDQHI